VTLVLVAYIRGLALNRSRTYALCCATGCVYVEKPWEKDNAHGLELDVMI
jgi:hypothetical protein